MSEIEVTYNEVTGMWQATRDGQTVEAPTPQEAAQLVMKQVIKPEDIDWIDPTKL